MFALFHKKAKGVQKPARLERQIALLQLRRLFVKTPGEIPYTEHK